jgi:ribonucleoside-diphosphate reductase alpha chain
MDGKEILSKLKYYTDYSKYLIEEERYETWYESVDRVMGMHRNNYSDIMSPELEDELKFAEKLYKEKRVLGSQRALQFGGAPIMKHNSKMYNCLTSYTDRVTFFQECFYWLLSGCGVGFSVQKHHIDKLQTIKPKSKHTKTFIVPDSIEGWSDSLGVLLSSYFTGDVPFPEYSGREVNFDFSKVRPKGAFISGGFKAPGPEGLRQALYKIDNLLKEAVKDGERKLRPIEVYDIVMHTADSVLSGGVRRSATIAMFSFEDKEMMEAKTGEWYKENPQRARSNISAVLLRGKTDYKEYKKITNNIKQYGEPGFIWTWDKDIVFNPCVEIGMFPQYKGKSGWQGCNLTEINGGMCDSVDNFYLACKAAAILGTLQAGYTDFVYVDEVCKNIFDNEALLGVSITGFASNPEILFDPTILIEGAKIVKETNKRVAKLLGIKQAARTTCVKPSGNASVVLKTASGIHPEHAINYFRVMQLNKENEFAQFFKDNYPSMIEESVNSATNTDYVIYVPIENDSNVKTKDELLGVNHLQYVKRVQNTWVEYGTNEELCQNKDTRHNVSNTIVVDDYDGVFDYVFNNQNYFTGISFLPKTGDKIYNQAPNTKVIMLDEIVDKYDDGGLFASGLIVDGLHAFDNLWTACGTAMSDKELKQNSDNALKIDWIRRFKQYADNFFNGDLQKTNECLKDLYLYHKWTKVKRELDDIEFNAIATEPNYTDVDTLGAIACSGGACEVTSI